MKKTKEPDQKRIAALVKSLLKELGEELYFSACCALQYCR